MLPNMGTDTINEENIGSTPLPEAVLERARAAVKAYYSSCFWFRHPKATIETKEDVRVVVEHLREYGDKNAWREAQEIHKCL